MFLRNERPTQFTNFPYILSRQKDIDLVNCQKKKVKNYLYNEFTSYTCTHRVVYKLNGPVIKIIEPIETRILR